MMSKVSPRDLLEQNFKYRIYSCIIEIKLETRNSNTCLLFRYVHTMALRNTKTREWLNKRGERYQGRLHERTFQKYSYFVLFFLDQLVRYPFHEIRTYFQSNFSYSPKYH